MQYAYAINKTRCYGSVYLGVVVLSGCELCWAVYKSGTETRGRGHRDACVGTGDLGTRDEGLEDIKYGTRGRVGRGRGDVKCRDVGDAECE